jgi:hypothetical protein
MDRRVVEPSSSFPHRDAVESNGSLPFCRGCMRTRRCSPPEQSGECASTECSRGQPRSRSVAPLRPRPGRANHSSHLRNPCLKAATMRLQSGSGTRRVVWGMVPGGTFDLARAGLLRNRWRVPRNPDEHSLKPSGVARPRRTVRCIKASNLTPSSRHAILFRLGG